jgi:tetratricopeptide (TPR) repeat protein
MVTDEGHAKIIDFGIAKLLERTAAVTSAPTAEREETAPGVVLGTTAYMSPEQARGDEVDHRSDIFSFGIVLHEMLSGQPPFQGKSSLETAGAILHQPAPRLPSLGPSVAVDAAHEIQRIVDKCLAKDPPERYQGLKDVVVDLRAARRRLESSTHTTVVRERRTLPRRVWVAAGVIAVVVIGALLFTQRDRASTLVETPTRSSKPSIAVLYFDNTTGNPDLDWLRTGITEMVVTDLSQSQDLEVVATDQLYDIIADLKRSDDRVMSPDVIRAVAQRTGVTNVLVGSYVKAGDAIRINVRLQEAQTGRIVSSERVEGPNEASLFAMVDELSRRLLAKFQSLRGDGGSAAKLVNEPGTTSGLDRGLVDVTTASIDAYRAYAEGINLHERYREAEAAQMFEKAIAIDPAFAMAYVKLAVVHRNIGNAAERDKYADLALKHADRLTPRERYYIEGYAYSNRNDSLPRSMDAYRKCIEFDPGHHGCRHNLGLQLIQLERFDESIVHYEELVRRGTSYATSFENLSTAYLALGALDKAHRTMETFLGRNPDSAAGHGSMGFVLVLAGRFDEAIAAYSRAMALNPTDSEPPFGRAQALALAEKWGAANEEARALASSSEATRKWFGNYLQMFFSLYRGRSGEAMAAAERAANAYRTPGQRAGFARRNIAEILMARSQQEPALSEVEKALALGRNTPLEPNVLVTQAQLFAQTGRRREAEDTIRQLSAKADPMAGYRDTRRVQLARGLVALAGEDPVGAIGVLESARATLPARGANTGQNPHVAIWYALGEAYLAAGRDREAAQSFQRVADAGYERFAWPIQYVRSFYFLGQINEKSGDAVKAREAYRRFLGYWKDGDLDRSRVAEVEQKLSAGTP